MAVGIFVIAILVVSAIFFFLGKGSFLLAGYNTIPEEEKKNLDEKKLLRWAGILLLIVAAILALIFFMHISHMIAAGSIAIVVLCLLFVCFFNSGFFKIKN